MVRFGARWQESTLQTCIVHLIRNSLDYAGWKERKPLAAAIKPIYTAVSAEVAELAAFEAGPWGQKFPTVVTSWRRAWSNVIPFFAFPPAVRRVADGELTLPTPHPKLRIAKASDQLPGQVFDQLLSWLDSPPLADDAVVREQLGRFVPEYRPA